MLVLQIAINVASPSVGKVERLIECGAFQTREQARFLICSDTQTFAEDRRMVNFNGCKIYNCARDFGVKVNDPHHSLGVGQAEQDCARGGLPAPPSTRRRLSSPSATQPGTQPRLARGETENLQTELSGSTNELLPDGRASQAASGANSSLEAVGEIDRPKVGGG